VSAATLREIASAVAMLASRKPQERAAGAFALARIAERDVSYVNNRKLVEFQEAVAAAGGIPLIVRALDAAERAVVVVVYVLCGFDLCHKYILYLYLYSHSIQHAEPDCDFSGRRYSTAHRPSWFTGRHAFFAAAGALANLSANVENNAMIASAGGIPPLIALLP
jgi:hypothetical protein